MNIDQGSAAKGNRKDENLYIRFMLLALKQQGSLKAQNKLYEYGKSELLAQEFAFERLSCSMCIPLYLENEGPQNFA